MSPQADGLEVAARRTGFKWQRVIVAICVVMAPIGVWAIRAMFTAGACKGTPAYGCAPIVHSVTWVWASASALAVVTAVFTGIVMELVRSFCKDVLETRTGCVMVWTILAGSVVAFTVLLTKPRYAAILLYHAHHVPMLPWAVWYASMLAAVGATVVTVLILSAVAVAVYGLGRYAGWINA